MKLSPWIIMQAARAIHAKAPMLADSACLHLARAALDAAIAAEASEPVQDSPTEAAVRAYVIGAVLPEGVTADAVFSRIDWEAVRRCDHMEDDFMAPSVWIPLVNAAVQGSSSP